MCLVYDVYFTTNYTKLFVKICNKKVEEVLKNIIKLYRTKRKDFYYTDVILDKLEEIKNVFQRYDFKSNIDEIIESFTNTYVELEKIISKEYKQLYEHQKNILPKLLTFNAYGMFWDMGTGKTLTSLIYMKEASKLGLKFIVLVPDRVLLKQWIYEGEKWNIMNSSEWNVVLGYPSIREMKWKNMVYYNYNITTYPLLRRDINYVVGDYKTKEWNGIIPNSDMRGKYIIIADEASKLKNKDTQIYKAVSSLRVWSKGLIALTGTPYENNLLETYNICRLIKPSFMTPKEFYQKYTIKHKWNVVYCNVDDYLERIKSFTEIVKKSDIVDLPDIIENWIKISTLEDKKQFLDDFLKHYSSYNDKVLGYIQILRSLDSYFNNYKYSKSNYIQGFDFKQYHPTNEKFKWLYNFLCELNEKCIIVTYYLGTFEALSLFLERIKEKAGIDNIYLLEKSKNFDTIKKFREDNKKSILLATSTIDYGVDLPNVNYLVNFDIHYNPARLKQRRDRIYRIGTTDKTFVYYLYGDLIESSVYDIILSKQKIIEYIEGSEVLRENIVNNIIQEWRMKIAEDTGLKVR